MKKQAYFKMMGINKEAGAFWDSLGTGIQNVLDPLRLPREAVTGFLNRPDKFQFLESKLNPLSVFRPAMKDIYDTVKPKSGDNYITATAKNVLNNNPWTGSATYLWNLFGGNQRSNY